MKGRIILAAAFLLVIPGLARDADAVSLIPMSTADMADIATVIMDGTITQVIPGVIDAYHGGARKDINTHVRVKVIERIKGLAPETTTLNLVSPGGTIGRKTAAVSGAPRFVTGQRALFFLWKNPFNEYRIIGLSQGMMPVQNSKAGEPQVVIPIPEHNKAEEHGAEHEAEEANHFFAADGNANVNGTSLVLMKSFVRTCLAAQAGQTVQDPVTGKPFVYKKNKNLDPWRKDK